MRVDVRCYGEVAAAVDDGDGPRTLDGGATVADLLAALDIGDASSFTGGLVVLVNGSHADADATLSDGDTVALSQSPMRE
ncbi:MoaD/ThiS family protein [Haloplanus rallus]|jgi:sulfur carrier protein ThiS|uniref:MoaD/ThiS family protein n=1 Tax=Haloplanus rallus TaxID=1816183 RepID=A0A6B9F959_9EURY|nr:MULTISPECIES: MoaD/ThiS family protein [Haloplanus]QGX94771.1 MoaD/ThiS family protein [Haloplanus rallus]